MLNACVKQIEELTIIGMNLLYMYINMNVQT